MGRKERHGRASILHSARELSVEAGPQKITIASVARHAGAPVGSIYHRYASRDEILAEVWLDLVEEFQGRFLSQLDAEGDAIEVGLAAVRFTCSWVRAHPREARLMLLHRRSDFAADRWPETYQQRAQTLAADAELRLRRYATRLLGRNGKAELRRVQFVLVDVPTAALKRDLEAGAVPSKEIEKLLLETCAAAFRKTGASPRRRP